MQHLRVPHRLIEVTVNDLYEGQIFLSSWRHGSQEETEDATAACLPAVLRKEAERGGGGGRRDLVTAFLFLLFNLADCHTQSAPSLFLHPSLAEWLSCYGNRLPHLPDNAFPASPTPSVARPTPAVQMQR